MRWLRHGFAWLLCALALFFLIACANDGGIPSQACERRELCVAIGGERPSALDFLTDGARAICVEQGITVTFSASPDFEKNGAGEVDLLLKDGRGRALTLTAHYAVVEDHTPPTLSGVRARSFVVGDGAVLREGVSVTDDCFGEVTLTVDTSELDMSCAGFYSVTYRAVDAVGNATQQTAYVSVYDAPFDTAGFERTCDDILMLILPDGANREQICRAVYAYVQATLQYFPVSDHSDVGRAAQTALETGRGDCFSYFALAKALLERAGVPCLAVERIHDAGEQSHFWLMVDLAEADQESRWYHYDPTELDTSYGDHNGCLFTDAQLNAYQTVREGFYRYDRASYPASATEILPVTGKEGER